jgi:predicted nucleic acid-binding protein
MGTASDLAATYDLGSHDALIVAVARLTEVPDVIALDRDFRRVDGLHLWQPS